MKVNEIILLKDIFGKEKMVVLVKKKAGL